MKVAGLRVQFWGLDPRRAPGFLGDLDGQVCLHEEHILGDVGSLGVFVTYVLICVPVLVLPYALVLLSVSWVEPDHGPVCFFSSGDRHWRQIQMSRSPHFPQTLQINLLQSHCYHRQGLEQEE